MSHSSSEPDLKTGGLVVAKADAPYDLDLSQEKEMFPWHKVKGTGSCVGFILQLTLLAAMGSFSFGINLSLLNTSLTTINAEYRWCDVPGETGCDTAKWYSAFMSTAVFIGAAIGSTTSGGFLSIGRRRLMLICQVVFTFGIVSSVVANSFSALIWARFVVGYGVGIMSVAPPTYMSEVTPAHLRGKYGVLHQLLITVGIFVGVLLGLPLSEVKVAADYEVPIFDKVWWRVMLGFGMVPVVLSVYLLSYVYTFETPHWYVEQGRFKDAEALLQKIHKRDDVRVELYQIIESMKEAEEAKKNGMTFSSAFGDSEYRHVIIVGCLLSAFQQFGGINVFIASSNNLFKQAGLDRMMCTLFSCIMTFLNVAMTFPTMYLIEKMGRKSLLFVGSIGQTIAVAPAAIMYWTEKDPGNPGDVTKYLAIVGVILFVVFFAVAYGPVLWVYLFEIYPTEIKDVAASNATMVNWIAGIIMVFVSNALNNNQISYTIFAAMCLISVFIIFLLLKETKGRSIGDSPFITKHRRGEQA